MAKKITKNAESIAPTDEEKIYVYIGPTVRGVIAHGTILKDTQSGLLNRFAAEIQKYPPMRYLIVRDEMLSAANMQLKGKESNIYKVSYSEMLKIMKENERGAKKND